MGRLLSLLALLAAAPAAAAEPVLLTPAPPLSAPSLAVVLGKAQILRLPKEAHHVVIGDPAVMDVTVDSPTLLFLFGRTPGETSLTVLDRANAVVMETAVAVMPETERHVTVTSPARGGTGAVETRYVCAGGRCAAVPAREDGGQNPGGPAAPAASPPPLPPLPPMDASGG